MAQMVSPRVPLQVVRELTYLVRSTGKSVRKSEYNEYQTRLEVFRAWFDKQVMNMTSVEPRWTAMVLPFDSETPNYRDEKPR